MSPKAPQQVKMTVIVGHHPTSSDIWQSNCLSDCLTSVLGVVKPVPGGQRSVFGVSEGILDCPGVLEGNVPHLQTSALYSFLGIVRNDTGHLIVGSLAAPQGGEEDLSTAAQAIICLKGCEYTLNLT